MAAMKCSMRTVPNQVWDEASAPDMSAGGVPIR